MIGNILGIILVPLVVLTHYSKKSILFLKFGTYSQDAQKMQPKASLRLMSEYRGIYTEVKFRIIYRC